MLYDVERLDSASLGV